MYEAHGETDNGGEIAAYQVYEGVVGVLDAVGAGLAAPEAGIEVFFEPCGGDPADATDGLSGGEAETVAAEEADAGDDAVGLALKGLKHAAGVGAVAGLVEDAGAIHDDGIGGEDHGKRGVPPAVDRISLGDVIKDRASLQVGQAHGPEVHGDGGGLACRLMGGGDDDAEGDAGVPEEFGAARGGGGEDEGGMGDF